MSKILKIILVVILFIGFFEAGLIASYTIVTSDVPDVKGLINLQVDTIAGIFSSENVNNALIKDPNSINITNKADVAQKLQDLSTVDGVSYDQLNVTTPQSTDENEISVNITTYGFSTPTSGSNQIILSNSPDYKILASATAKLTDGGYKVDVNTIQVVSILKLYNNSTVSNNSNTSNSSE